MKGADFRVVTETAPPAASNGTHRTRRPLAAGQPAVERNRKLGTSESRESAAREVARAKNGSAPKRSTGSGTHADARPGPQPIDATFATIEAEPIDAPMWPLHPALWFQPELAPSAPAWTGLAIEHHNRIPAPDFLQPDTAPPNRPDTPDNSRDALTPGARCELPHSGLEPLGWDPRAVCRKEGDE